MQKQQKNNFGFTVLELIVVIVIIGILFTVGINTYSGYQARSRDTTRAANAKIITSALEKYYTSYGEYPNIGTLINTNASLVARTIGVDPKVLVTPSAPAGTTNSIANFDTTPDTTTADVYRYEGIFNGDAEYSDCKNIYTSDLGQTPQPRYKIILSSVRLAASSTNPRCKAFVLSYKQEATNTWKYITSVNN